jgi:glycosyltransferase
MKISIITVVYNNKKTILDAIMSVHSQTYKNIEHIIIDGGSDDGTLEILKQNSNLFNILISEKDSGLYHAMNKGIKIAKGDIIGILNSDDLYFNSNIINEIMSNFILDSSLDLIYGDIIYVKHDNINIKVRDWKSGVLDNFYFEKGNVPPHPSLFIKKCIYDNIGLFNLDFKIAADYEFMLRLFKIHTFKYKYLPLLIVKMRSGGISNRNLSNILKQNFEIINAWKINNLKMPFYFFFFKFYIKIKQFV